MSYQNPSRNTESTRWEGLRAATDLATVEMDDEISAKYYDYWRQGESSPWGPFDTKGFGLADYIQFNLLCTMIQDMHTVMFHKINHRMNQIDPADPNVIPQADYRYSPIYDDDGRHVGDEDLVQIARDRMDETTGQLGVETSQMTDHYRQRVKDLAGYDFKTWAVP